MIRPGETIYMNVANSCLLELPSKRMRCIAAIRPVQVELGLFIREAIIPMLARRLLADG